jgi:hypothetical protein
MMIKVFNIDYDFFFLQDPFAPGLVPGTLSYPDQHFLDFAFFVATIYLPVNFGPKNSIKKGTCWFPRKVVYYSTTVVGSDTEVSSLLTRTSSPQAIGRL